MTSSSMNGSHDEDCYDQTQGSLNDTLVAPVIGKSPVTASGEAEKAFKIIENDSSVFDIKKYNRMPRFDFDEISLGPLLGKGAFSNVYEIEKFHVKPQDYDNNDSSEYENYELESKMFIASHCIRKESGDARYAIKFLMEDVTKQFFLFKQGAADLINEAALLSSLYHPNIVKLRGLSVHGTDGFDLRPNGGFFIVFDRLYDTLEQRIRRWSSTKEKSKIFLVKSNKQRKAQRKSLAMRLNVAFDLAHAFQHLHERRILYRDIKPENIGFDVRNDVKLFDFGLAFEFTKEMDVNSTFRLPGKVGTPRYMAPEVARSQPYNMMADVYSFSILLWEIAELKTPFTEYNSHASFYKEVSSGGSRPKLRNSWPMDFKLLLQKCWTAKINERPKFHEVIDVLRKVIMNLRDGDTKGLEDEHFQRRSSTFRQNPLVNDRR